MRMTDYDAVLVGGGHNGLVCAAYLAGAGRRVLVLEANQAPGGCAATREFAPGFSVSACAQWLTQFSPAVSTELALEQHGLQWAARDLASIALDVAGEHLTLRGDQVEGGRLSIGDREAYRNFYHHTLKFARVLAGAFAVRAPRLVESNLRDRLTLLRLGLALKRLGREDMSELMRIILINMYDLMQDNFDSPQLQALLSMDGVLGSHAGPRSPNTVFAYLYRRVGDVFGFSGPAQVRGGMGSLGEALAVSARAAGAEMRLGAPVASIDTASGRALGVTLGSGERIRSSLVVSSADPVTTFEQLVGYRNLETGTVRRVSQIRHKSGCAKLHLALDSLPQFTGLDQSMLGQRLVIAPDMDYIERAFNAIKYSECPASPALDISLPSVNDDSLAHEGKHVLSAIVQFAPYAPAGGWERLREVFTDQVLDCLAAYAPGIRQQVLASELLTPYDLEREFHMRGGHWHHAELSLDQVMMMRPFPGATQYATPIDGLYLCGAGAHPGGGLMGLAGKNAAQEIIRRETA